MRSGALLALLSVLIGCGVATRCEPEKSAPPVAGLAPEPAVLSVPKPKLVVILLPRAEVTRMAQDLMRFQRFQWADEILNMRTMVLYKAEDAEVSDDATVHWINDHVLVILSPCAEGI